MQSLTKMSAGQTRSGVLGFKRRWIHQSLRRQGSIMMPAFSPLMTEGTITRWRKQEGEAFVAGEVLLQIRSDFYAVDIEAQNDGILGKILAPDGSTNVPVEQVIALVARNANELTMIQNGQLIPASPNVPTPPPFNLIPDPPSISINPMSANSQPSPRHVPFSAHLSPRTPTSARTPSLFEKQSMGYGHRTVHTSKASQAAKLRVPRLEALSREGDSTSPTSPRPNASEPIPSPFRMQLQEDVATTPLPSTPLTARWPGTAASLFVSSALPTSRSSFWSAASTTEEPPQSAIHLEGHSIRRMIVAKLAGQQATNQDLEAVL